MTSSHDVDDNLRITSAQREHAVELVRQAAADGRLDFDEMNARVAIGLDARTQGELRRIVGDLVPSAELAAFLADVTPPLEGPGSTWENPLLIGADRKAVKIVGPWQVPPFLEVYTHFFQMVSINFLEAVALAPVIDLVSVGHSGAITMIMPRGWGVDTERLSIGPQGQFRSDVATRPAPGFPRIVMRGHISGGRVRYAKPREVRSMERRRAEAQLHGSTPPAIGP